MLHFAEKLFLILSLNLFIKQFSMQQETSLRRISFITYLVFPAFLIKLCYAVMVNAFFAKMPNLGQQTL